MTTHFVEPMDRRVQGPTRQDFEDYTRQIRAVNGYPRPRTQEEIEREINRIPWSSSGVWNSEAVIEGIHKATGFKIPAEDKYMQRLHTYKRQVLPYQYPTCPVGWERHTSLPDKAREMGVAWMDADGYFCGPPGSSPATKYDESSPMSNRELVEQIQDLKIQMRELLEPNNPEVKEQKKRLEERQRNATIQKNLRKEQNDKRVQAEKERHIRSLVQIYRKYLNAADAKKEAGKFYKIAKYCTDLESGRFSFNSENSERTKVSERTVSGGKKIYVPNVLLENDEIYTPKLREWFREFRKQKELEHLQTLRQLY